MTPILIDTREPWPHPWAKHLPEARFEQQALDTGDIALAANPMIVVERKTVSDFLGSITAGRDRFERELARSRHLDHFCVIVEGSMIDCMDERGGLSAESLIGTVAAYGRRKFTIHFAGTERYAARLAWRILTQPVSEANKLAGAAKKAEKKPAKETPKKEDGTALY